MTSLLSKNTFTETKSHISLDLQTGVTIQKHGFIKKGFSGQAENFLAGGGLT